MIRTIENESIKIAVNDLGAELFSLVSKKDGFEYLWQGDPAFWTGRAYNLFPICGRLIEGRYTYKGKSFEMIHHGFARKNEFTVKECGDDYISFSLCSNDEFKKQYPFDFELIITYKLIGNSMEQIVTVKNTSTENELIFGVGGHPGFNLPLEEGMSFDDYFVEFCEDCAPKRLKMSPTCFMTDETPLYPVVDSRKLMLYHSMFDDDAIFLTDVPKEVTLRSEKNERSVTVSYPDMKYLGLWHVPKKEAPYICIEPWYSVPAYDGKVDDLDTKRDMIHLEAGGVYENKTVITVR